MKAWLTAAAQRSLEHKHSEGNLRRTDVKLAAYEFGCLCDFVYATFVLEIHFCLFYHCNQIAIFVTAQWWGEYFLTISTVKVLALDCTV